MSFLPAAAATWTSLSAWLPTWTTSPFSTSSFLLPGSYAYEQQDVSDASALAQMDAASGWAPNLNISSASTSGSSKKIIKCRKLNLPGSSSTPRRHSPTPSSRRQNRNLATQEPQERLSRGGLPTPPNPRQRPIPPQFRIGAMFAHTYPSSTSSTSFPASSSSSSRTASPHHQKLDIQKKDKGKGRATDFSPPSFPAPQPKIGEKRNRAVAEYNSDSEDEFEDALDFFAPKETVAGRPAKKARDETWTALSNQETAVGSAGPVPQVQQPAVVAPVRVSKRTRDDVEKENSDADVVVATDGASSSELPAKRLRLDLPRLTLRPVRNFLIPLKPDSEEDLPRPMLVTELPPTHPLRRNYQGAQWQPSPSATRPAPTRSCLKGCSAPSSSGKTFRIVVPASYARNPNEHNFATWRLKDYEKKPADRIFKATQKPVTRPSHPKAQVDIPEEDLRFEEKLGRYEAEVKARWGIDLALIRCVHMIRTNADTTMIHSLYPGWAHCAWNVYSDAQILGWENSRMYQWTRRGVDGQREDGANRREAMKMYKVWDEEKGEVEPVPMDGGEEEEEDVDTEQEDEIPQGVPPGTLVWTRSYADLSALA